MKNKIKLYIMIDKTLSIVFISAFFAFLLSMLCICVVGGIFIIAEYDAGTAIMNVIIKIAFILLGLTIATAVIYHLIETIIARKLRK